MSDNRWTSALDADEYGREPCRHCGARQYPDSPYCLACGRPEPIPTSDNRRTSALDEDTGCALDGCPGRGDGPCPNDYAETCEALFPYIPELDDPPTSDNRRSSAFDYEWFARLMRWIASGQLRP